MCEVSARVLQRKTERSRGETVIRLENVTKLYGNQVGIKNLSLTARPGEILGLLGPNGAGKSTTMGVITGYLTPTSGRVEVLGIDVTENPLEVKKHLGYLPEVPPLYDELTVDEYLKFVAEIKGLRGKKVREAVNRVMLETGLAAVHRRLIGHLSHGFRQRVGLAQAIINDPAVLVLDEPTSGLDPQQITEIRSLIRELARNRTVILSSHILPEVSMLCRRVAILNRGELVAEDTPENLAQRLQGGRMLTVTVRGPAAEVGEIMRNLPGVEKVEALEAADTESCSFSVVVSKGKDVRPDLFFALAAKGYPLLELRWQSTSLEEIFLNLVTREPTPENTPKEAAASL
ncbi:MAG: gliding motility-associated transport system ATP-binding protein [Bacillota bacterium]|nr:gliding motility-associated transport system ATP-binding protein [Bacillota bacterium]MDK2960700.1 gliding motility-associated transport system ATP-binding protein [Bacillota bacterium]